MNAAGHQSLFSAISSISVMPLRAGQCNRLPKTQDYSVENIHFRLNKRTLNSVLHNFNQAFSNILFLTYVKTSFFIFFEKLVFKAVFSHVQQPCMHRQMPFIHRVA